MGAVLAFLTGPIGRVLLIALLCAGIYVKGRVDQGHADEVRQEAATAVLAEENLKSERFNSKRGAAISNAHAKEIAGIQGQRDELKRQLAGAKLAASIQPKEDPNAKPGMPKPDPIVVDIDDILLGPDFVGLWNDGYNWPVQDVPGAGQPADPVPAPGKAGADAGREEGFRDASGPGQQAYRGPGPGQDVRGSGGPLDRMVQRTAEVTEEALACLESPFSVGLEFVPIVWLDRLEPDQPALHLVCSMKARALLHPIENQALAAAFDQGGVDQRQDQHRAVDAVHGEIQCRALQLLVGLHARVELPPHRLDGGSDVIRDFASLAEHDQYTRTHTDILYSNLVLRAPGTFPGFEISPQGETGTNGGTGALLSY